MPTLACNACHDKNSCVAQFQRVALPRTPPRPPGAPQPLPDAPAANSCGIHAIALSPERRLLATGGANPSDCQILAVRDEASIAAAPQAPQLDPVQTLVVRAPRPFRHFVRSQFVCFAPCSCHKVAASAPGNCQKVSAASSRGMSPLRVGMPRS